MSDHPRGSHPPVWDGTNWNEGYVDNNGRMRVYRPDYPNAYKFGYALRAHIVYWLKTEHVLQKGECIHHRNEKPIDDEFENLALVAWGKHTALHNEKPEMQFVCNHCGKEYTRPGYRVRSDTKKGCPPRFCSHQCYCKHGHSKEHNEAISKGIKKAYMDRIV